MKHTVTEHQLTSGSKGLLIDVPGARVVNILVRFNSGYQFGDFNYFDVPHVLEHMLAGGGTKTHPRPNEYKIEIAKNGGVSNANTWDRYNGYTMTCAEFELERFMDLLSEILTEPVLSDESFKTEMGNVREELTRNTSNWGRVNEVVLAERTTPWLILTDEKRIDCLSGITSEMVRDHFARTHTAKNARFYLSGAVGKHSKMILDKLDQMFNKMPAGERLQPNFNPGIGLATPIVIRQDIKPIYYNCLMFGGPLSYRQEMALGALQAVLFAGFAARVYGEARRRGLAYHISGDCETTPGSSSFGFSGYVSPDNVMELMKLVSREMEAVAAGQLKEDELISAKNLAIGRRELRYQTAGSMLNYYVGDYDVREKIRPYEKEIEDIRAVTLDEVASAARHVLSSGQWGISWLGNLDEAKAVEYTAPLAKLFS